jgi:hypothetical protein
LAAFRILRAYVHELLETDYPDLVANAAVEFINEMAVIDCLPAAARVLDYLRAAGDSVPSLPGPWSPMPPPRSPPTRNAWVTRIGHPSPGSTLGTRSGRGGTSSICSRLPPNDVLAHS